jgi:hypothetical protein
MRNKLLLPALLLAAALLFFITNRGAYRNYFQADSLDNLALAHAVGWDTIVKPLVVPTVPVDNFRPVGAAFLKLMSNTAKLRFPPYIAALQFLHLINALLVYLQLRKLGLPPLAAATGALFFAFHMALFSVLWEPMFVFDLLCGFFCLLSLLTYIDGRWIASFLLFWLAYRSKENAVMLPLVLAAWEFRFGQKKWPRLVPFFALSLVLGVQAMINNATRDSAYTLQFDPVSIWVCMSFYSSQLLLIPFAGLAILAAPLVRNRRLLFGFIAFCVLMVPMLMLPGRLFGAYLYVPLIAVAICVATLAELQPKVAIAIVLLLWVPWNYVNMRHLRTAELTRADKARVYIGSVVKVARENPQITNFVYHDIPMESYAISGAVGFIRHGEGEVRVLSVGDPEALKALQSQKPVAVLDWAPTPPPGSVVTLVRTPQTPDISYIKMDRATPVWQLTSGWNLGNNGPFRWIAPSASARLARPADAKQFELVVNVTNGYLKYEPHIHLKVLLDGHLIGERDFDRETFGPIRWDLDPAPAGIVNVSFEVTPGFRTDTDSDLMGLSVGNFGFVTQ